MIRSRYHYGMGWYQVIKTIKGRRYLYLQRSRREGKRVRTENKYIGPAGSRIASGGSPIAPNEPPISSGVSVFHLIVEKLKGRDIERLADAKRQAQDARREESARQAGLAKGPVGLDVIVGLQKPTKRQVLRKR